MISAPHPNCQDSQEATGETFGISRLGYFVLIAAVTVGFLQFAIPCYFQISELYGLHGDFVLEYAMKAFFVGIGTFLVGCTLIALFGQDFTVAIATKNSKVASPDTSEEQKTTTG